MANCPHSYPQTVDKDVHHRSVVSLRGHRRPSLGTAVVRSVGSRVGRPGFVAVPSETALPEANSFLSECQPFCNIGGGFLGGSRKVVTAVVKVKHWGGAGQGLTAGNLVSTLEQSPVRGDTAATQRAGDRAG